MKKTTQIIHVNLLKAYHSRDNRIGYHETFVNLNFKVEKVEKGVMSKENESLENIISSSMPQTNSEILSEIELFLSHLVPCQMKDIKN